MPFSGIVSESVAFQYPQFAPIFLPNLFLILHHSFHILGLFGILTANKFGLEALIFLFILHERLSFVFRFLLFQFLIMLV